MHGRKWREDMDRKVWSTRPGGLLKKPLLVLDQFRAHITEATKKRFKEEKIYLAVIPGGAYQPVATFGRFHQQAI